MFTIWKSALSWCNALFDRQPSVVSFQYIFPVSGTCDDSKFSSRRQAILFPICVACEFMLQFCCVRCNVRFKRISQTFFPRSNASELQYGWFASLQLTVIELRINTTEIAFGFYLSNIFRCLSILSLSSHYLCVNTAVVGWLWFFIYSNRV